MNNLLLEEYPLIILPKLAKEIGLNEAVFIQQVHFWVLKTNNVRDGHKWIYNSYEEWQEQFPFWSISTIRRTISKLESQGLLITGNYNTMKQDHTRWFRVDYEALSKVGRVESPSEQTACSKWTDHLVKMNRALPEITTDIKDSNFITGFEQTKTPEKEILKDSSKTFKNVEDLLFNELKAVVEQISKEHKLNEKYLLTDFSLSKALDSFKSKSQKESEANDTVLKGLEIPFKSILKTNILPLPEFSINKRVDKTSFLKILLGYIKRYERFPTEEEMIWIQETRKGAKKPFTPSEVEQGMDLQIKDGSTAGFDDTFTTYLWNARTNYAQPKKKQSTALANDIPVISDFSDFD